MERNLLTILLFCFYSFSSLAQSEWFGNQKTNPSIFLDPTEIQVFGSITGISSKNALNYQYLPFGFGGSKSIYSRIKESGKVWEILGEFGTFSQFEWKIIEGSQQRNFMNVDFKAAATYTKEYSKENAIRVRFYHVSSHLGDDYILRNKIRAHTTNKVNYEQLEFTHFRNIKNQLRYYYGLGAVIRINAQRLPFSYHFGFDKLENKEANKWNLTYGLNCKGFQETNFDPNIKLGIGYAYQNTAQKPLRILAEYYSGHLPYSQLEQSKLNWIGLGVYFNF